VQTARDDVDRQRGPQAAAAEASVERERHQADGVLERERSAADALLGGERSARRRYLAEFLAVEREATDQNLIGERAHSDTEIASRDAFLETVSHDLRSLLGGLSLTAGLLCNLAPEGPSGDAIRRHGATNQRLVARMNRLISDLLDVSSIEAGKLAVVAEPVEISALLSDTVDAFAPLAASKGITLVADAEAELHARLDGGRILQVLANLVSNAIKFTPAGGRVAVHVRTVGDELKFSVSDTGIGMPEDEVARVFERFHQVSKDRRGLGLGLHIAKGIVEAHGGRVWAETKAGAGSTFHVALPRDSQVRLSV
jgi:signal transduction histidine kinase